MSVNLTMVNQAQRLLRAVERARLEFLAKTRPPRHSNEVLSGSYIDRLPIELIISIFSHTEWRDVVNLRLVCRAFKELVDTHENHIVSTLLSLQTGTTMYLLAQLFRPPKQPRTGLRRPTLQYIRSLEQRHVTCDHLAYHLAARAVSPIFSRQSAGLSRKDKKTCDLKKEEAIERVQGRLMRQLYYVEHFLRHIRLHLSAFLASLAAEDSADTPPTPQLLSQIYAQLQADLIGAWPDEELVSTHHAFHFLVNSIRLAISPEPPHNTNDDTVCLMLRCPSSLQRCNEFFAADTPSAPGRLRRQFMLDMEGEKEKAALLVNVVYNTNSSDARGGGGGGKRGRSGTTTKSQWNPRMGEVWFEIAKKELRRRGLERHWPDGIYSFPEVGGEVMVGCPDCIAN